MQDFLHFPKFLLYWMTFPNSAAYLALSTMKNHQILQKIWIKWRKIFQLTLILKNGHFWYQKCSQCCTVAMSNISGSPSTFKKRRRPIVGRTEEVDQKSLLAARDKSPRWVEVVGGKTHEIGTHFDASPASRKRWSFFNAHCFRKCLRFMKYNPINYDMWCTQIKFFWCSKLWQWHSCKNNDQC